MGGKITKKFDFIDIIGMTLLTWKLSIASRTILKFGGSDMFNIRNRGISWMNTTKGKSKWPCPMILNPKKIHLRI